MINFWIGHHQVIVGRIIGRSSRPEIRVSRGLGATIRVLDLGVGNLGAVWTTYGVAA